MIAKGRLQHSSDMQGMTPTYYEYRLAGQTEDEPSGLRVVRDETLRHCPEFPATLDSREMLLPDRLPVALSFICLLVSARPGNGRGLRRVLVVRAPDQSRRKRLAMPLLLLPALAGPRLRPVARHEALCQPKP